MKEPSVIAVNETAEEEARLKNRGFLKFGVKDTNRFPRKLFDLLRNDPDFLWNTVDRMADKGRSIDTVLTNPLTYRAMTGSTSGGAVNILLGINDFALGTDGGGSVLAPALSCQLPSFIAAGIGIFAEGTGVSTDGIEIRPSVGVIGKSVSMLKNIFSKICGANAESSPTHRRSLNRHSPDACSAAMRSADMQDAAVQKAAVRSVYARVAVPGKNSLYLPTGEDMNEKLAPFAEKISDFVFEEVDMRGGDERKDGIEICKKYFEKGFGLILTYEGPIDVLGYGETIPARFGGVGPMLAKGGGKFLLKAANPAGFSAMSVPSSELASGFVIIANRGMEAEMFGLAEKLEALVTLPEVFVRYFLTEERCHGGFEKPNP